jgi:hypothetical protein
MKRARKRYDIIEYCDLETATGNWSEWHELLKLSPELRGTTMKIQNALQKHIYGYLFRLKQR